MPSIRPATTSRKRGMLEGVAQIGESFEDGHAGTGQLFEMEAEIDELRRGRRRAEQ